MAYPKRLPCPSSHAREGRIHPAPHTLHVSRTTENQPSHSISLWFLSNYQSMIAAPRASFLRSRFGRRYADSYLDSGTEAFNYCHKTVNREPGEVRITDAGKIRRRMPGAPVRG